MIRHIDFRKDPAFLSIFARMQIDTSAPVHFQMEPYQFTDIIWNDDLYEGLRISPDECMGSDFVQTAAGLRYHGRPVIVYWSEWPESMAMDRQSWKYHFAWCKNLERLQKEAPEKKILTVTCHAQEKMTIRRYDRNGSVSEEQQKTFRPCEKCLEALDWQHYRQATWSERFRIAWRFSLQDYLRR